MFHPSQPGSRADGPYRPLPLHPGPPPHRTRPCPRIGGGWPRRDPSRPVRGPDRQDYDAGFVLYREIGAATVGERAARAVAAAPEDAVLAGVSMGAGLLGHPWSVRPASRGVLLIAGAADWDPGLRPGLPVQAHIARPDPFDDEEYFSDWAETAPGVALDLRRYEGVGHYLLDSSLSDFGETAARECRAAKLAFLAGV